MKGKTIILALSITVLIAAAYLMGLTVAMARCHSTAQEPCICITDEEAETHLIQFWANGYLEGIWASQKHFVQGKEFPSIEEEYWSQKGKEKLLLLYESLGIEE